MPMPGVQEGANDSGKGAATYQGTQCVTSVLLPDTCLINKKNLVRLHSGKVMP